MAPSQINEDLDLGVTLSEADTEVEKLQARLSKLEAWFTLPKIETLSRGSEFDTRNFIIGSLYNRKLCTLDVLTETSMTVHSWKHFLKTGQLDEEVCKDLLEWLGINLPTSLHAPTPVDVAETEVPEPPGNRRRVSFSTSSRN